MFGITIAASIATFAIAHAVGGASATEDNWAGYLIVGTAFAGLCGSLCAFVLAIVAEVRRESWALLWLPLCVFPAFFLFLILGEALWWE